MADQEHQEEGLYAEQNHAPFTRGSVLASQGAWRREQQESNNEEDTQQPQRQPWPKRTFVPDTHARNHRHVPSGHQDNRLYTFGDSFIGPLSLFNSVYFSRFSGASAKGLSRLDTTKQARQKIADILKTRNPTSIFFGFGNVDLQINYFYKQSNTTDFIDPFEFSRSICEGYCIYLKEVLSAWGTPTTGRYVPPAKRKKMYISSVILPVIETEHYPKAFGKYSRDHVLCLPELDSCPELATFLAQLSQSYPACDDATRLDDIRIRRQMVRLFNEGLQTFCKTNGCIYVDVNPHIADAEGNVGAEYRDPADPTNIHILWEPVLPFWVKELSGAGLSLNQLVLDIHNSLEEYVADKTHRVHRRQEQWARELEDGDDEEEASVAVTPNGQENVEDLQQAVSQLNLQ